MSTDIMNNEVIQGTRISKSVPLEPMTPNADVKVVVSDPDERLEEMFITLQGQFPTGLNPPEPFTEWRDILTWRWPDPPPDPVTGDTARRLRLTFDPSAPVSVGAYLEQ